MEQQSDNLDNLFEMSNIGKSESGLPVNIYVSSGGSVNKKHSPRIKIMSNTSDKFDPYQTISIIMKKDITTDDVIGYARIEPKTLKKVREYVNLNYDALLAYWLDEISTSEMIKKLKSLND